MAFDAASHTKKTALACYVAACAGADYMTFEAAAHALAQVLQAPRASTPSRPAPKNKRRGARSLAFAGVSLPIYQRQACGHTFNSAGCAACVTCQAAKPRRVGRAPYPAIWGVQDRLYQGVLDARAADDAMKGLGKIADRLERIAAIANVERAA